MNERVVEKMEIVLVLKGYSKKTTKTYLDEIKSFLRFSGNHNIDCFNSEKIKAYLLYCHRVLRFSEAAIHSKMNAIKFYYEQVLKQ
jgi:integrase/recombinase XerD